MVTGTRGFVDQQLCSALEESGVASCPGVSGSSAGKGKK